MHCISHHCRWVQCACAWHQHYVMLLATLIALQSIESITPTPPRRWKCICPYPDGSVDSLSYVHWQRGGWGCGNLCATCPGTELQKAKEEVRCLKLMMQDAQKRLAERPQDQYTSRLVQSYKIQGEDLASAQRKVELLAIKEGGTTTVSPGNALPSLSWAGLGHKHIII